MRVATGLANVLQGRCVKTNSNEYALRLEIDYPDAETDLDRFLPLVKWLLAIPHYIALLFLNITVFFAVILA